MPYMLAPGARLMVGPHGQLEESMGALAGPGAAFMAQIAKPSTALHTMATTALATGKPMPIFNTPAPTDQVMYASPGIAPQSSGRTIVAVGIAAAIGLGIYAFTGRGNRRRR